MKIYSDFTDSEGRLVRDGQLVDTTTREFCQRCHRISPVGFLARDDLWKAVASPHWQHSVLCILCFAELGDEKHIAWEEDIEFFPVSYATHHATRAVPAL